jgi:HEAT repeat protein
MRLEELAVLLPLAALLLWLTIFLFTLVDHFIYRETYGHFLLGLDAIERQAGSSDAGVAATAEHMRRARTHYLARYLGNAGSRRGWARLAAEEYVSRVGADPLVARAADPGTRRRARHVIALYALSRTSHPGTLPLLERALGSEQPLLAYAALDMLDVHGTVGAAEVLLRALEIGVLPASRIATHMENFRIDLTDLYVSWLHGDHPKSRYWIAYLLGRSGYSERTAEILEGLLSDPAANVRKIALSSLAALDTPGLQARAVGMLDDPAFFVRTQAARILARFPVPNVVHALARRLSDENDAVQLAVKRSLVELGAVTLQHLPAHDLPGSPQHDTISQIRSSIRHALEAVDEADTSLEATRVR